MTAVWSAYAPVLVGTAAALPIAILLVLLRMRHTSVRRAVAEVGAVYGTLPWLAMTLTPDPGGARRLDLVPLRDLAQLAGAPLDVVVVQLVGNLLVFAAAGALLPLRYAWFRSLPRVLLLGAVGSTVIETLQYVLGLGRVSAVDDVLVNAAGAVLAAAVTRPWWWTENRAAEGIAVD